MARVYTKKGDVFCVKINDTHKKYFQLIAYDLTQLNSDVIRAFEREYPLELQPTVADIINDDVTFYAHCVTRFGVKLGLWEKVGSSKDVGDISKVLFRGTTDYGTDIKVSHNWYVWHINDEEFTDVGKLTDKYRKADLGIVFNPYNIFNRISGNNFISYYPD